MSKRSCKNCDHFGKKGMSYCDMNLGEPVSMKEAIKCPYYRVTKPLREPKTHLLLIRTYNGKNYDRYHSYDFKSDVDKVAKKLRSEGYLVRIHNSPLEKLRFTVYRRKK